MLRRMELRVSWMRPIPMKVARDLGFIYTTDLDRIPDVSGVYVSGESLETGSRLCMSERPTGSEAA
jgi:hypothetical protein